MHFDISPKETLHEKMSYEIWRFGDTQVQSSSLHQQFQTVWHLQRNEIKETSTNILPTQLDDDVVAGALHTN